MPGLIGKKIGMTSMFSEEGKNIPCTIIEAGPCTVTQIKTKGTDGYDAVQLGFDNQKDKVMPFIFYKGFSCHPFLQNL